MRYFFNSRISSSNHCFLSFDWCGHHCKKRHYVFGWRLMKIKIHSFNKVSVDGLYGFGEVSSFNQY